MSFCDIFSFMINYKCPFREYFHFYCAGCGTVRMIESIIKLDLYQAFRYNPLLFILLFLGIISIFYIIICRIFNIKNIKIGKKGFYFFVLILIAYTILRNIQAFNYLVPTKI